MVRLKKARSDSGPKWSYDGTDYLLYAISAMYVFLAPYTKVEESFNLQAIHDFIYHRFQLSEYDHLEFPGVVPRTFWGALGVAAACAPLQVLLSRRAMLLAARTALAAASVTSLCHFKAALREQLGRLVGTSFAVLYACQFHPLFYAGRPLPNVFATAVSTWACAEWVRGRAALPMGLLTAAAVLLRCDMVLLLGPVTLHLLLAGRTGPLRVLKVGIVAGAAALAASLLLDSLMWQRLVWPEGEVLWFNTVENRSGEWGVMPPHWYLTSALPRALLAGLPFAGLGAAVEPRARPLLAVALSFVLLYSRLPHKELRFIFPVLPLFNACAATFMARMYINRHKSRWRALLCLGVLAGLLLSLAATALVFLPPARANYPGGAGLEAVHRVHEAAAGLGPEAPAPRLHIGNRAAMSGASRFGEQPEVFAYSKQEALAPHQYQDQDPPFTYLLSDHAELPGFVCLRAVPSFQRLQLKKTQFPFLHVATEPQIYIHYNKALTPQFQEHLEMAATDLDSTYGTSSC